VADPPSGSGGSVQQLDGKALEDIRVVNEYPDVFPEELPGMPPDRDVEFLLIYYMVLLLFLNVHIECLVHN
jgi:hypothetical protein